MYANPGSKGLPAKWFHWLPEYKRWVQDHTATLRRELPREENCTSRCRSQGHCYHRYRKRECHRCVRKCLDQSQQRLESGLAQGWSEWSSWTSCSQDGRRSRTRQCQGHGCPHQREKQSQLCEVQRKPTKLEEKPQQSVEGPGSASGLHQPVNGSASSCPKPRRRKDVNSLSRSEKSEIARRFTAVVKSGQFERTAGLHGFPYRICKDQGGRPKGCCPHGDSSFLFWHRLLLVNLEDHLGVALPLWDWTDPRGTFPSVLEEAWPSIFLMRNLPPNICPKNRPEYLERQNGQIPFHRAFSPEQLLRQVELALDKENFEEFSAQVSLPHNSVHNLFHCNLRSTGASAFDPVFWLHHAFVDLQLVYWQELQRLRGNPLDLPSLTLPPFHRKEVNKNMKTLSNSKMDQALDHKNFCYEYDQLKINGKTPQQYFDDKRGKIRPSSKGHNLDIGLIYLIGVVLPKMAGTGHFPFHICAKNEKCVNAGGASTFGNGAFNSSGRIVRGKLSLDKCFQGW